MSFLVKNNILYDVQHGFHEGKSTESAIHASLENIQKTREKKMNIIRFFFFKFIKGI